MGPMYPPGTVGRAQCTRLALGSFSFVFQGNLAFHSLTWRGGGGGLLGLHAVAWHGHGGPQDPPCGHLVRDLECWI